MKNRRRIAQALAFVGALALFLLGSIHGTVAYRQIVTALASANVDPKLLAGLKAINLIVAWHWIVIGVIVLACSFGSRAPRKSLLLLCGLAMVVDTAVACALIGPFIGDELLTVAGLAILGAVALFPSAADRQS